MAVKAARLEVSTKAFIGAAGVAPMVGAYPQTLSEADHDGCYCFRWLGCTQVAPALIPRKAGDKVKTDSSDSTGFPLVTSRRGAYPEAVSLL